MKLFGLLPLAQHVIISTNVTFLLTQWRKLHLLLLSSFIVVSSRANIVLLINNGPTYHRIGIFNITLLINHLQNFIRYNFNTS